MLSTHRPHVTPARLWRALPALLIGAAALAGACHARAEVARADVRVVQHGRAFMFEATLDAPVPPALAWAVPTDVDRRSAFVPNLADSRVVARDSATLTIVQHGAATFGPLSYLFDSECVVTLLYPTSTCAASSATR